MDYVRDRLIRSNEYYEGQRDRNQGWSLDPKATNRDYIQGWRDKDCEFRAKRMDTLVAQSQSLGLYNEA